MYLSVNIPFFNKAIVTNSENCGIKIKIIVMKQNPTKEQVLRCLIMDLREQERKHLVLNPIIDLKEIISYVNKQTYETDFLKEFVQQAN
jgi:hypothetical protein